MLLKFCFIFLFIQISICNVFEEKISNEVLFPNRQNRILFVLSKNCSAEIYQNLMNAIFNLEQNAHENFSGDEYNINLRFGGNYSFNFTKSNKFYQSYEKKWCQKNENCFQRSLTDDIQSVILDTVDSNKSCPEKLVKEFIVVVSDLCLSILNTPLNDLDQCSKDYRQISLLLPTKTDVEKCKAQILQNSDSLNIQFYSSDTISSDTDNYSDMNVLYQSTYAESTFNLLVMVNEIFSLAYYILYIFDPKLPNFAEFPLCRNGSISGFFQYISLNTPTHAISKITSPLNYKSNSIFPETYKKEVKKAKEEPFNCDFIKEFLITANSMPLKTGSQYNMLLINDPYPKCLEFELLWNNTNRHLEIVVVNTKNIESNYSNFISLSNNSLSHLRFYKWNQGLTEFWEDTAICKTEMKPKNISEKAKLITTKKLGTTTLAPVKLIESGNDFGWWIFVGGIVILIILLISIFLTVIYFITKFKAKKRMSVVREHADTVTSALHTSTDKKYWNSLIDDKNVCVTYDVILGKGSKSIVYQAIIKKLNMFHAISATKVAAKILSSSDIKDNEEVMNEINCLSNFEGHPNIIKLKGWFLNGDFPVILTEFAETDLLRYVKSIQNPSESTIKSNIRIIWDICKALKYLTEKGFIHRDIACRNVLLMDKSIVKLADFALCCKFNVISGTYRDSEHEIHDSDSKRKRFPLKWLSIEALTDGIFSEKSDVWAFGVLCFEVFSSGAEPYQKIEDKEIVKYLKYGKRLEKPIYASNNIYEIMLNCWAKNPSDRLSFKEIYEKLEHLLAYGYLPLKNEY